MSDAAANFRIDFSGTALEAVMEMQSNFKKLVAGVGAFESKAQEAFRQMQDHNKKLSNSMKQISFAALADNVRNVTDTFREATAPGLQFQQQIADLSAITGVTGADLGVLEEAARSMGKTSGIGASQAAEAFKLLASNIDIATIGGVEGLKFLQKETITLAQAAGTDLPMAADTMSFALNQFQLPVAEAARVINVLGAGAKYGAAEIPDLAAALKDSGAVAKQAGLSIEDATGAIEILSQRGLKGSEAGNALRNVLLILQTQNIPGVNLKTQGLSGALQAMQKYMGNATYMAKLFGRENINAAQILISGASAVKEMTDKVTGTNVAYEQAAIRTKTYQHEIDLVKSKIDDFKIGIFNSTGALLPWAEYLMQSLVPLSQMVPLFSAVGSGVKALTTAQWALNSAQYAMPVLAIVAGLTAIGVAVYALTSKMSEAEAQQKDLNDIQLKAAQSIAKEKVETDRLFDSLKKSKVASAERRDLIDQINSRYPGLLKNMNLENAGVEEIAMAYRILTQEINKKARADAAMELLTQKEKDIIEKEVELSSQKEKFRAEKVKISVRPPTEKEINDYVNEHTEPLQREISQLKSSRDHIYFASKSNSESSSTVPNLTAIPSTQSDLTSLPVRPSDYWNASSPTMSNESTAKTWYGGMMESPMPKSPVPVVLMNEGVTDNAASIVASQDIQSTVVPTPGATQALVGPFGTPPPRPQADRNPGVNIAKQEIKIEIHTQKLEQSESQIVQIMKDAINKGQKDYSVMPVY